MRNEKIDLKKLKLGSFFTSCRKKSRHSAALDSMCIYCFSDSQNLFWSYFYLHRWILFPCSVWWTVLLLASSHPYNNRELMIFFNYRQHLFLWWILQSLCSFIWLYFDSIKVFLSLSLSLSLWVLLFIIVSTKEDGRIKPLL